MLANQYSDELNRLKLDNLKTADLMKVQEKLNQIFADEVDFWYNYTADGEEMDAAAHYYCALLISHYINKIHDIVLSRAGCD